MHVVSFVLWLISIVFGYYVERFGFRPLAQLSECPNVLFHDHDL